MTAVTYLCNKVKCPTKSDKKLGRVMGYLSATKDRKLVLTYGVSSHIDAALGTYESLGIDHIHRCPGNRKS